MAGRDDVAFEGIGGEYATFIADGATIVYSATEAGGAAVVGRAVTLSTHKTIALAADGEMILGKLLKVEADGMCTVQYKGYMSLPAGTGATLTVGSRIVGDLLVAAEGYIRSAAASGAAYAEAEADETQAGRGFIVDASDTENVIVYLS